MAIPGKHSERSRGVRSWLFLRLRLEVVQIRSNAFANGTVHHPAQGHGHDFREECERSTFKRERDPRGLTHRFKPVGGDVVASVTFRFMDKQLSGFEAG